MSKREEGMCCHGGWSKFYEWRSLMFHFQRTQNYWGLGVKLLVWPMVRVGFHVGPYTVEAGWPRISGP